ncbi:MAG: nucleotidyltransferase domain-containing protein [Candidatus Kerfeldbacteria bacterium]|nr:nucleotidyltransferase domain-containing protein [Candidatus Kerfeldbacteria bacterium]
MARKNVDAKKIAREYTKELRGSLHVDQAFLFGSYARGSVHEESDVDLLIISRDFVRMPFMRRLELLNRLRTGSALEVPMDIIGVTPSEFSSFRSHESGNLRGIYHERKRIYP